MDKLDDMVYNGYNKTKEADTMIYAVTKKFHSGLLEGMEYKCLTGVKFEVGKDYGEYIVTFCKPVDEENDVIAIEGSKFGVPCAFSNGTLEFARATAKCYRDNGYDAHMYLMD